MKNKSIYELGVLAQKGDDMAMLEIIERKKNLLKKYSYGDEDTYQYMILKLIEGIKKIQILKNFNFFGRIFWTCFLLI